MRSSRALQLHYGLARRRGGAVDHAAFDLLPQTVLAPAFAITVDLASYPLTQGQTTPVVVTLARGATTSAVTIALSGLPTGVSVDALTIGAGSTTGTLTLTATTGAALGPAAPTLTATAAGKPAITRGVPVTVLPAPPAAIGLTRTPGGVTLQQGQSTTVALTLTRTNYAGVVTLAASGLPSGLTASFAPPTLSGGTLTATLTLTAGDNATTGGTTPTLTASGSGVPSATAPLAVTLTAQPVDHVAFDVVPQTVSAPPATANAVAAQVVRFVVPAASSDPTVTQISHLFPLPPGRLTAAQVSAGYGRVMINGVEQQLDYIDAPTGPGALHPDGTSLRGVFLQCRVSGLTQNTPVSAEVRCGEARMALTGLGYVDPNVAGWFTSTSATGPSGEAYADYYNVQGMILPTSAADLCDSGWFWWTRPRTEDPTSGAIATYCSLYDAKWDAAYTSINGSDWDGSSGGGFLYYERGLAHFCHAARRGSWALFKRGVAQVLRKWRIDAPPQDITHDYDIDTQYFMAQWFRHGAVITSIKTIASQSCAPANFPLYNTAGSANFNGGTELRPMGNAVRALLYHFLLNSTTSAPNFYGGTLSNANLLKTLLKHLSASTSDDPSFTAAPALPASPTWRTIQTDAYGFVGPGFACGGLGDSSGNPVYTDIPFQSGIFMRACILVYEWFDLSNLPALKTLIRSRIQGECDNIVSPACWRPSTPYGSAPVFSTASYLTSGGGNHVNANGGPSSTGTTDIGFGFLGDVFYWLAWKYYQDGDLTSRDTYVDYGDQLFDASTRSGIDPGSPYGLTGKPWAEYFQRSTQAIGLRAKAFGA